MGRVRDRNPQRCEVTCSSFINFLEVASPTELLLPAFLAWLFFFSFSFHFYFAQHLQLTVVTKVQLQCYPCIFKYKQTLLPRCLPDVSDTWWWFSATLTIRKGKYLSSVFPFALSCPVFTHMLGISRGEGQQHLSLRDTSSDVSEQQVDVTVITEKQEHLVNATAPHSAESSLSHVKNPHLPLPPGNKNVSARSHFTQQRSSVLFPGLKGFLFVFLQLVLGKRQSPHFECLYLYIQGHRKANVLLLFFVNQCLTPRYTLVISSQISKTVGVEFFSESW